MYLELLRLHIWEGLMSGVSDNYLFFYNSVLIKKTT